MMGLLLPRDVDTLTGHGWTQGPNNLPFFYVDFTTSEETPRLTGMPTRKVPVNYRVALRLMQNVVLPRVWRLDVGRVANGHTSRDVQVLGYFEDPVACSVELKLLGDGDIAKGVEEMARDTLGL